jgi:hypothetical protein
MADENQWWNRRPAHSVPTPLNHSHEILAQRLETQIQGLMTRAPHGQLSHVRDLGQAMASSVQGEDARARKQLADLGRQGCERETRGAGSMMRDEERGIAGWRGQVGVMRYGG